MPSTVANIRRWRERAQVDWFGHYIQAWLAFNAWYRHNWPTGQEREAISNIAFEVNAVRSNAVPLYTANYEVNLAFQANLSRLHHRLEASHVANRGRRVSFTDVDLGQNPRLNCSCLHYSLYISATRSSIGSSSVVLQLSGSSTSTINHSNHSLTALELEPNFVSLSPAAKQKVRLCYLAVSPKIQRSLLATPLIIPGASLVDPIISYPSVEFHATDYDLFAATVFILYDLRCVLFHGEVVPDDSYNSLYAAAYDVLMQFNAYLV